MPLGAGIHILDFALLLLALLAASYFAIKLRSRKGIVATLILSLSYFGFYRGGCVCVVGSIQNVSLALFNNSYQVSWVVFAFFAAPIVFTLFFGRAFCGAVCPLGAIQDIFIFKPLKVPRWLEEVLGMIPYLYLGVAVLFAATGTGFIICGMDFFVGFFRFSGPLHKMLLGAAVLALGIFIARPYCRFLCPYGVLLRWASLVSWKHLKISPADCVKCSLCVDACPFGAIDEPTPAKFNEPRSKGVRRLAILILILPLAIGVGALAGHMAGPMLATVNPVVRLAAQQTSDKGDAEELVCDSIINKRAAVIEKNIIFGSMLLGIFIGLVIALKLISLSMRRSNDSYVPEQAKCLECARCLPACPVQPPNASALEARED
jgi:polyferredoxin